jgi:hypothetical protein
MIAHSNVAPGFSPACRPPGRPAGLKRLRKNSPNTVILRTDGFCRDEGSAFLVFKRSSADLILRSAAFLVMGGGAADLNRRRYLLAAIHDQNW